MSAFCVKCKTTTPDLNPRAKVTKNGRNMIQSQCGKCGTTKSMFVSGGSKPKRGRGIGRVVRKIINIIFYGGTKYFFIN